MKFFSGSIMPAFSIFFFSKLISVHFQPFLMRLLCIDRAPVTFETFFFLVGAHCRGILKGGAFRMCKACGERSCVPDCCLPCGHIANRRCLEGKSPFRCPFCRVMWKVRQLYPFFPTWESPLPPTKAAAVPTTATDTTNLRLQRKLSSARAACELVSAVARRRKRERCDNSDAVAAHLPPVLKTTLLSCSSGLSAAEMLQLPTPLRLRDMVDLGHVVSLQDAIRQRCPCSVAGALCWCERLFCDSNGNVATFVVAVTIGFEVVFPSGVHENLKLPVRCSAPCAAAAVQFVSMPDGNEFFAVAVVSGRGEGGLFRVSLQRAGEVVLLFPFTPGDFLISPDDITSAVQWFLEMPNNNICLLSALENSSSCGMYHVLVLDFSVTAGISSEALRVAMPVLMHSCPHRLLHDDTSDAPVASTSAQSLLQSASWPVRLHHFSSPRRTVALVSWGESDGGSDGDVFEELREGHSSVLLVRETLFCLSIYSFSGSVLGSVHSDVPVADFAWCRDEHRGRQNRVGGDEKAFYCHLFVLGFDGGLREFAVHI
jgi:hypothetical protein